MSPTEEPQAGLRDYLDILRRRRPIVISCFLVGLTVAVAASLIMPPTYRASATVTTDKAGPVLVDKPGEYSLTGDQGAGQAPDVLTLAELIKSDAVRSGAMFRLAPTVDAETANAALAGLAVQQLRLTELVRIVVDYTNPRIAARAANAVADSLVDMNLKARRRRATETRAFIGREMRDAIRRLRHAEDGLVAFRDSHGDVSLSQETSLTLQKAADLQAQLVDVRMQRAAQELRIAEIRDLLRNRGKLTPTPPSPLTTSLKEELAKLEIELSGMRREFTQKHPTIISTDAKIEETKQHLDAERARSLRTELVQAETTIAGLDNREREMRGALGAYDERMRVVPVREVELARLTRDVKETEQIYLMLSDRYEQARIAESSIGSLVHVVDRAKVPSSPVKPRRQLNTLFGALLGLFVGVVGALLAEHLDDTVNSAEDIERVLGAPVLGAIPMVNGAARLGKRSAATKRRGTQPEETPVLPLIAAADRRSPAAEAYRALRTHVLFSIPDVRRKRLLVTSALPREGKSTIAANLAAAIAYTDRRVWLIDSDLRRPTLGRWFGGAGSPGLAGVLAGQVEVDSVVRPTVEPNLSYVESGPTAPNPTELLGSQHMLRLMERAQSQAAVVLVDSPPMLPVTDAEVIAGLAVDGVVLVVRAGQTSRRALAYVRKRLDQVGAKLVGAVLNCVPNLGRAGYYYGSYYSAYDSQVPENASRATLDASGQGDQKRRAGV